LWSLSPRHFVMCYQTTGVTRCGPGDSATVKAQPPVGIETDDYGTRHSVTVWGVITMCAACASP